MHILLRQKLGFYHPEIILKLIYICSFKYFYYSYVFVDVGAAYVVRVEVREQFLGVSSPLLPRDSWALTLRWPGLVAGGLAHLTSSVFAFYKMIFLMFPQYTNRLTYIQKFGQ